MLYARIHDGKVVEIGDFPSIEGRFTPDMVWVPCSPEVRDGWLYDGSSFSPPPPPPREEIRERMRTAIKNYAQNLIWSRYPQWRQANMQARCTELLAAEAGQLRDATGALIPARPLTPSEQAELVEIVRAWTWIKAVRAASDQLEARLETLDDPASLNIADAPEWPR